jgi:hypothetical protein
MKNISQYIKFVINVPREKFKKDVYKKITDEVDKEYKEKIGGKNKFAPKVVKALLENFTNSKFIIGFLNALTGITLTDIHTPMVVEKINYYQISFVIDEESIKNDTLKKLKDKCGKEGFEISHF